MTIEKDGGPAFPLQSIGPEFQHGYSGMTLRDYFAAKAMQAFLSGHIAHHGHESHWPYDQMVYEAYAVADAMLKQRESPQE